MLRRRERLAWLGSRGNWVSTATRDGHDRGSTTEAAELAAVETPQAAPPQRHGDGAHAHGIADKQDWTFKRGGRTQISQAPRRDDCDCFRGTMCENCDLRLIFSGFPWCVSELRAAPQPPDTSGFLGIAFGVGVWGLSGSNWRRVKLKYTWVSYRPQARSRRAPETSDSASTRTSHSRRGARERC